MTKPNDVIAIILVPFVVVCALVSIYLYQVRRQYIISRVVSRTESGGGEGGTSQVVVNAGPERRDPGIGTILPH
jgi:hypothetical protein